MSEPTKKQEETLREFLHSAVVPLIEDVLVKKLGQAMSYAKEQFTPPSKQEPVAWMYDFLNTDNRDEVIRNWVTQDMKDIEREKGFNVRPLYAAPVSKPDVNQELVDALTSIAEYWNQDTNHDAMVDACHYMTDTAQAALAKLKEKNT